MNNNELLSLSHTIPIVVEFWAPWCEPCFILEPILDELANENFDNWKLVKINIDENVEIAETYGIRSVPTTAVFLRGELLAKYNGIMWKKQFGNWINATLAQP